MHKEEESPRCEIPPEDLVTQFPPRTSQNPTSCPSRPEHPTAAVTFTYVVSPSRWLRLRSERTNRSSETTKNAFGSVPHHTMWEMMLPARTYTADPHNRFKPPEGTPPQIPLLRGIEQGCPLLFNLVLERKNKIAALLSAYMNTRLSTAHKLCFRVPCAICASPYIRQWFVIITNIQKSPSRGPSPDCQPLMATSFGEERS